MTETSNTGAEMGPYGQQYGQQPWLRPRPASPQKSVLRWLWIPGAVAFLSIALPVAVVAATFDEIDAAVDDGRSGTPDGLSVELVEGHKYWLYTDVLVAADSCTADFGTGERTVTLSRSSSSLAPEPAEPGYELLGSFIAPDDGVAVISCPGSANELVIFPDDSVLVWVGLAGIAGVIGLLAAIAAAIVIVVVWSRRRKRAAQEIGGWYGPSPPGWPAQPYPQAPPPPQGWPAQPYPQAPPSPQGSYPPPADRPARARPEAEQHPGAEPRRPAEPQPKAPGPSLDDPWAPPAPPPPENDDTGTAPRR